MADPVSAIQTLVNGVLKIGRLVEQIHNNMEDCHSISELLDSVNALVQMMQETPSVVNHDSVASNLERLQKDLGSWCGLIEDYKKKKFASRAWQANRIATRLKEARTGILVNLNILAVALNICNSSKLTSITDWMHQQQVSSVDELAYNLESTTLSVEETNSEHIPIYELSPTTNNQLQVYFPSSQDNKKEARWPVTLTNNMNCHVGAWIIGDRNLTCINDKSEDHLKGLKSPRSGSWWESGNEFMAQLQGLQCQIYWKELTVTVVERSSMEMKAAVTLLKGCISLDVHPIKPLIVNCSEDGWVQIWDFEEQKTIAHWLLFPEEPARCTKFIATKNWVAFGDCCGKIHVYGYNDNAATIHGIASFVAHKNGEPVDLLAVHPTGEFLLSSSYSHSKIRLHYCLYGEWQTTREFDVGPDKGVYSLMFNPRPASASFTCVTSAKRAQVWYTRNSSAPLFTRQLSYRAALFTHNEREHYLVTLGPTRYSSDIWDTNKDTIVHTLGVPQRTMGHVATHSTRPLLATSFHNGTLGLWDTKTYRLEKMVQTEGKISKSLGFLQDTEDSIRLYAEFSTKVFFWKVDLPIGSTN